MICCAPGEWVRLGAFVCSWHAMTLPFEPGLELANRSGGGTPSVRSDTGSSLARRSRRPRPGFDRSAHWGTGARKLLPSAIGNRRAEKKVRATRNPRCAPLVPGQGEARAGACKTLRLHLALELCKDRAMPNGHSTPPSQAMSPQTPAEGVPTLGQADTGRVPWETRDTSKRTSMSALRKTGLSGLQGSG